MSTHRTEAFSPDALLGDAGAIPVLEEVVCDGTALPASPAAASRPGFAGALDAGRDSAELAAALEAKLLPRVLQSLDERLGELLDVFQDEVRGMVRDALREELAARARRPHRSG